MVQEFSHRHQGRGWHHVHRVWIDRRPGVGCRDRCVDGDGQFSEFDVPDGLDRADHGGRRLNGINSVYPRVPPLDVMSSLRASYPGRWSKNRLPGPKEGAKEKKRYIEVHRNDA